MLVLVPVHMPQESFLLAIIWGIKRGNKRKGKGKGKGGKEKGKKELSFKMQSGEKEKKLKKGKTWSRLVHMALLFLQAGPRSVKALHWEEERETPLPL